MLWGSALSVNAGPMTVRRLLATIARVANVVSERMVYTISVEATFTATHGVRYANGTVETPHDHEWRVRAFFRRARLDDVGMVVDFGEAQSALLSVVKKLENTDLNDHRALRGVNPTAENLARHIFEHVQSAGMRNLCRIELTEAPGCVATFEHVDPAA